MLTLPQDLKEAAAREKRRRYEEERKKRIFNARRRVIGVDEESLQLQIAERRAREEEERRQEAAFDEQRIKDAKVASLLEKQIEQERRRINEDINYFRAVFQKPESRREFDLYDPDGLKKALPARIDDNDPRCGISSAQKFQGEDLSSEERLKQQQEQNRAWLEQQIIERREADAARKAAQAAYEAAMLARDKRACDLDRMEQECRKKLDEATTRFNQALATEQAAQRRADEQADLEDKQAELYNLITSDMLTENPDVSASSLGPHRAVGYLYKGMTPEQRAEVRRVQLLQIEERRKREEEEMRRNAEWDKLTVSMAHTVEMADREQARLQWQINKKISEQNKNLSHEQLTQQHYLNKIVFTNEPTAAYFEQFNTSTR